MPTTVNFESPPGNPVNNRQFDPGQILRVCGHITSLLGFNGWKIPVRVTITGDGVYLYGDAEGDFLGNYFVDFILPYVGARANVRVITTWTTNEDIDDVPISIGNIAPDPVPTPTPPSTPLTSLETALKWLPWVALGIGA